MTRDLTSSQRLRYWLERWRFSENPFASWVAEEERDVLPELFVDRPYMLDLLDNPARPRSAFLLATRGAGKTTACEIVAHECSSVQGSLYRRVLAVRHNDFSRMLDGVGRDVTRLTTRHHVAAILRATMAAIADSVPTDYYRSLKGEQPGHLLAYSEAYGPEPAQRKLRHLLAASAPLDIDWEALSPLDALQGLADLIAALRDPDPGAAGVHGLEALYVLVDRVDESAVGAAGAAALLRPLLLETALFNRPHLALKFFLPCDVFDRLVQEVGFRRDRVSVATIEWDEASLAEMLNRRLDHFSGGHVEDLGKMFPLAARTRVFQRLAQASANSPRTLLRLCEQVVRQHLVRGPEMMLDARDVDAALAWFESEAEAHGPAPTEPGVAAHAESPAFPSRGLYIDPGGQVWIDGERLPQPLPGLEFQLLRVLYRAAPRVMSSQELIEEIWGAGSGGRVPEEKADERLRRLMARLRDALSKFAAGSGERFVRNARGRGYFLNRS